MSSAPAGAPSSSELDNFFVAEVINAYS